MKNLKERAAQLLSKNSEQNEVHFTSDGFPFFNKAAAEGHASRLSNRDITTITRAELDIEDIIKKGIEVQKSETAEPVITPETAEQQEAAMQRNAEEQAQISDEEKATVATQPVEKPVANKKGKKS